MESLENDIFFKYNPNTLEEIRKNYNMEKPGAMNDAIDILQEWLKKKNTYLRQERYRNYLERTIIRAKGSIEKAKQHLDKLCSRRKLFPSYFDFKNVKELKNLNGVEDVMLPTPTIDNYRVYFLRNRAQSFPEDILTSYCLRLIYALEYQYTHDYVNGIVAIFDCTDANLNALLKGIEFSQLQGMLNMIVDCYSLRVKGIHVIFSSKETDTLFSTLKQVLSSKIGSRILVHKSHEELFEHVERDVFPADYGGKEARTLSELHLAFIEVIQIHPSLKVTPEQIKKNRELCGIFETSQYNEALDSIEEWLKKQDHLVEASKYMSRRYLERLFFLLAQGSIEMTKAKIDKIFTMKTLMPELSLNKSLKEFDTLFHCVIYVPLPKLNPNDLSRVNVTQFFSDDLENWSILSFFRFTFMIAEYRLHYDYSGGDTYIMDFKNLRKLSILTKFNPIIIKKADILCTKGYGPKVKGIHIINAPAFVDKLVKILKQALSAKLASRLFVHNSYEDLHKYVPTEILPKDYGGDEMPLTELDALWKDTLATEEATRLISETDKLVSDESKRQISTFNQEYLGMPGSFRTLSVD